MKIIKKRREAFRFLVLRAFSYGGEVVQPATEIEILTPGDQTAFVLRRMIRPLDLPEVGTYLALRPLVLPGKITKFECKAGELIEVKADDALKLMVEKSIIPADPHRWRPYNMRLGEKKRSTALPPVLKH